MPTFDPSDRIGRTFLLPPEENGERHRAKVTRQVVEIIDQDNGQRIENMNYILDIGNGKVEELISYNQLLEHLENAQDHDMGMDQELYRFRAIIGDTFLSMFRLCSCGTKPQRSENHHFVMTSSWEPQCHHDIIMRTPRITEKLKFSWSGGP